MCNSCSLGMEKGTKDTKRKRCELAPQASRNVFKHFALVLQEDIYSTFSMSTVSSPGEELGSGGDATSCCWPPWPPRLEVNLTRLALDPGISTLKRKLNMKRKVCRQKLR